MIVPVLVLVLVLVPVQQMPMGFAPPAGAHGMPYGAQAMPMG